MTPWQRRLRVGLGLFVIAFAAILFVSIRRPVGPAHPDKTRRNDPKAVTEQIKGTILLAKGTSPDYKLDFERLVQYADGRSTLLGVKARVPQRGGRDFLVTAKEGEVVGEQPKVNVKLHGSVELTTSDGLKLNTEDASYLDAEGVVQMPGPVTFSRNRMSGSAVGLSYDKNRDTLWLLDKAVIQIAPDENGKDSAHVEAGAAGHARRDKYIRFERHVKVDRDGQTIEAEGAVAFLTPDEKRIQMVELRGASRVTGKGDTSGGMKGMTARDMNLTYGPDGKQLQRALLNGDGVIELGGVAGRAGRRLAGQFVDVALGPDGTTVTGLSARDRVQLDLPADAGTPARRIRGGALQAAGQPGVGLTRAEFSEDVDFQESSAAPKAGTPTVDPTRVGRGVCFREPAPPAGVRVARSGTLDLALKNGFTTIESARFGRGACFQDSAIVGTAREARYGMAAGSLNLSGADEKTGRPPQVSDEHATIEASRIEILLDAKKITAIDSVKSDMRATKPATPTAGAARAQPAPPGGNAQTHLPSILKEDQPVSATADSLVYDSSASHAVYTGHAQLWQGDVTIKADTIVLDDQKGDLSASGAVVSKMLLEQVNDKTKAKERVHSVATAKALAYDDKLRRATYTGAAHLTGPQGDLTADRIELFLKESGNEVDRLEAYVNVAMRTPDNRKASGARLTYLSAEERYDMTGLPVRIEEECRETIGKSLTFFKSADRIIVDGNEERRTETKGGGKCPGPRFD
ncbi:MAG TPA: LptA/OstA family protein [Vicinamibacterales bacterium]|jgi:lipopolysaccharide export system protein LptA